MIKTILVPATDARSDAIYAAAGCVARLFGAHVDALHVRGDPVEVAAALSADSGAGAGMLLDGIIDSLTRDADAAEARARAAFAEFCARDGMALADTRFSDDKPSAAFRIETGQEAQWMSVHGLTADLAIAVRGSAEEQAVARSTLEALLLETGRPLLIPGPTALAADFVDRVAIAWKPTPQAARAVAAALPFLMRAKAVDVLIVDEDGGRDGAERLVRYLAWHGITAVTQRLVSGSAGGPAALLAASAKSGLLVMGGYGHARFREWVFGGFTQAVIDHAELPVLMVH